jgi:hypothetical protein
MGTQCHSKKSLPSRFKWADLSGGSKFRNVPCTSDETLPAMKKHDIETWLRRCRCIKLRKSVSLSFYIFPMAKTTKPPPKVKTPQTSNSTVSDKLSTKSGSNASVISRKAKAVVKDSVKAVGAVARPFKKLKHSLSTRTQSSVADDNVDPPPTDQPTDLTAIDITDNDSSHDTTAASSDVEEENPVDPQKALGRF